MTTEICLCFPCNQEYDIWDGMGPKEVREFNHNTLFLYQCLVSHQVLMANKTKVSFPYKTLRNKVDLQTRKGVKFAVLSCADMIKQKEHLAGQDPVARAHGLGKLKGTTDFLLGTKKLANDAADVKCIQSLVELGGNGPCDPIWLQKKIRNHDFTGWAGPTEAAFEQTAASKLEL